MILMIVLYKSLTLKTFILPKNKFDKTNNNI